MAVEHENDTLVVYNPLNKPFTTKWGGVPRTIEARGTAKYPRFLAEHIAKHLADFVLQVKEYQYKKKFKKEVNLMRNTKEREKVLGMILRGVEAYFMPQDESGVQMLQNLNGQPSEAELKKAIDLGDVEDDTMGITMDDLEIASPPEARSLGVDSTKQEIMEQLTILGVEFSDRETKAELLAKLGITDGQQTAPIVP